MRSIFRNTDYLILILALLLSIIGIVGIYSAGVNSTSSHDEYKKQIVWVVVSMVAMFVAWVFDYHITSVVGLVGYPICLILLVAVLFTTEINGASSWFNIGPIQIQPSEFMKIAYILTLAKYIDYISTKGKRVMKKQVNN